jgi:adenylate kinase
MNLILLGPPGSGKGTQAEMITRALGVPQVSTGDIIRTAIRNQTPLGVEFKRFTNAGALVPDDLVNQLVRERLAEPDCAGGFMLDGYPRTVAQAEWLDRMLALEGRRLDSVVLFDVADAVIVARITGRRTDPVTGHIYHLTFDPPPAEIADRLVHRPDDTEDVLVKRLAEYHAKTAPLIPYYEDRGVLVRVDGVGPVAEVQQRAFRALGIAVTA